MKRKAFFTWFFATLAALSFAQAPARPQTESTALPPLVEYPYISIYYSEPTILVGQKVELKYYVTDWNHSRVRLGDKTKRFDVTLEVGPVGGPYKTLVQRNIPSGDHVFSVGPFHRGDYEIFIRCRDLENKLDSHRVLHDFRVRTADELEIPESKIYRMTEADLAAYGIVPEREGLYREVFVPTPDRKTVLSETNLPQNVSIPADGYVVFVPCTAAGERHHDTWKTAKVVYGAAYDHEKQAAIAAANTAGLQRLIDEKKAAGFRKLVLLKRIYRVAHEPTIFIPTAFTLDLGQATVKLDRFTGNGCYIFRLKDTYDSHLVNGTVAGDYYEHDYANSKNSSEWVDAVGIDGDSHYTSIENLLVTHITGYGSTIGMSGPAAYPGCKVGEGMMGKPQEGAIDPATGEVVPAKGRFTGKMIDISSFGTNHLICVTHRLDPIRGLVSRSWYSRVGFYDAEKKFIASEVAFLYRPFPIPKGAKFACVTIEEASYDGARRCDLTLQRFRVPSLCAFRNNRFYLNRSTGHVPFVCRENLTADNLFDHCGETLTHCAIDAEDGWEGLHDLYLLRNRFVNIPNASMILNAGQNIVVEGNSGSITVRARCVSPCVRDNDCSHATFLCGTAKGSAGHEHTMHARIDGNRVHGKLILGASRTEGAGWCTDGWTIHMADTKIGDGEEKIAVELGGSGRFRGMDFQLCSFEGGMQRFAGCKFDRCTFTYNGSKGAWTDCTINRSTFLYSTSNVFARCQINDSLFADIGEGHIGLKDCKLVNTTSRFGYWRPPTTILMDGCAVKGTNALWNVGCYTIGRFQFRNSSFDLGKDPVVRVPDCRKNKGDAGTGIVSAEKCTFKSPLYRVTSVSEFTSERPVVFAAANCMGLRGKLGEQAKPQKNYTELVDAEWLRYKKENGIREARGL